MVSSEPNPEPELAPGRGGILGLGILGGSGMVRAAVATGAQQVGRRLEELDDARRRIAVLEGQVRTLNVVVMKLVTHTRLQIDGGQPARVRKRSPRIAPTPASPPTEAPTPSTGLSPQSTGTPGPTPPPAVPTTSEAGRTGAPEANDSG